MTARKDLTGRKFGRLLVVEYVETNHNYKTIWLCKCDCGNEGNFIGNQLLSGHTQSCGCLHSEMLSKRSKTHGLSKNRACAIWYGMMRRCYNKEQSGYERYGGRGITVCDKWHDKIAFVSWAMENGHKKELTLDRKDNNAGYYPDNCRWATLKEQGNNMRNNVILEINGRIQTLMEWSAESGIGHEVIRGRIRWGHSGRELLLPSGNLPPREEYTIEKIKCEHCGKLVGKNWLSRHRCNDIKNPKVKKRAKK